VAYWSVAQLQPAPGRDQVALRYLHLAGFETYQPRLRERRIVRGRRVVVQPPLFPGYLFIRIEQQWYAICSTPGVIRLIRAGDCPARVPDAVINELRGREHNGLIELAKPPRLRPGDPVRIVRGIFSGHRALYVGQTSRERIMLLLSLLGGQRRIELPKDDVEVGPVPQASPCPSGDA
jgi:transcriptional antiterminator RfaH